MPPDEQLSASAQAYLAGYGAAATERSISSIMVGMGRWLELLNRDELYHARAGLGRDRFAWYFRRGWDDAKAEANR